MTEEHDPHEVADDAKAEKAAHEEAAKAELSADNKALSESHVRVFEVEHAERQHVRVQRALKRLTDQELEAEIGRRRK